VSVREWQWPGAGHGPVNYGLDPEIFDSEKFPHAQTFVREAIQNSLDARLDKHAPVRVRFDFHTDGIGPRAEYLSALMPMKEACGLAWPAEWKEDAFTWLVVEDSNSSGLNGSLQDRMGDFWNYWMNFGISNKDGAGRGGRGIGRITFLIASGLSSVIGVTRRAKDGQIAACGMSLLKPVPVKGRLKSSFAYLALRPVEDSDIYELYADSVFQSGLVSAFGITDYAKDQTSGLSLIIPYPHHSLTPDGIAASAIEHFAPAIIGKSLVVEVNGQVVDHETIDDQAIRIQKSFASASLREHPLHQLDLIRHSAADATFTIKVTKPLAKLAAALGDEERAALRKAYESTDSLCVAIEIPVTRSGKTTVSTLKLALAHTPKGHKPIDLFFREGMCLPEVEARNPADVDLVVQSNEGELVSYLNFCEGKAHLGLIENKEVRAKLIENGLFDSYAVKRLVRRIMDEVRALVLPDADEPDASIFSSFFSITKPVPGKGGGGGAGPDHVDPPPPPPVPPIPRQPNIFLVDELPDGFRVRANPEQTNWPANLRAEVVYADGSRKPKWSEYDFELSKLPTAQQGTAGTRTIAKNVMIVRDCGPDFQLEITGFDVRRELITSVKGFRNA
jgi:hypothetical protein